MKLRNIQYYNDRDFILKYLKRGKILDVGCGGGFFLSKFPKKFNKIGLDLDKRSSEIGKKKFNIKILNKKLGDEDLNKNTFNLIIFRGVIEHLYDPKVATDRAYTLLKKGRIFIFLRHSKCRLFSCMAV